MSLICLLCFKKAISFNQQLVWNTSKVTNMHYMFSYASSFNKTLELNVPRLTDEINMFLNSQGRFILK